jgi:hypothetical protein
LRNIDLKLQESTEKVKIWTNLKTTAIHQTWGKTENDWNGSLPVSVCSFFIFRKTNFMLTNDKMCLIFLKVSKSFKTATPPKVVVEIN